MGYNDLYIFLIPLYALSLGMSAGEIGALAGARHLLPVFLSIHIGVLMDRFGTRRVSLFFVWLAIALAPIIVLAFGIGDMSKIVTSWIVVVFLVFFNTFEGARSIDEGFINVARLLGASEWQITRTVVIPSTMAWVFASLTPAISFALIGVIVGEFIGAERGIGRLIIESEARGEASGMMVAVMVLMLVGVVLSALIWRLQAYLLRWQQHNMAE